MSFNDAMMACACARASLDTLTRTDTPDIQQSRRVTRSIAEKSQHPPAALLTPLPEEAVYLKRHDIKGWCLHTRTALRKGTVILEYKGILYTKEQGEAMEELYAEKYPHAGCYSFYFTLNGIDWCIDSTFTEQSDTPDMTYGMARYMNHSKKPNVVCRTDGKTPRIYMCAKRGIAADEELTFNYGDRSHQSKRDFEWL
jgi:SET domain-containing protein